MRSTGCEMPGLSWPSSIRIGKPSACGNTSRPDPAGRKSSSITKRHFSIPAVRCAPDLITIGTPDEATAANATLPCGARLISTDQRGRYVNALFRLTGRPGLGGSSCGSGAGATARTNFVIAHGRIVEWIRAPDDPGDNHRPGAPTQPPASIPQS